MVVLVYVRVELRNYFIQAKNWAMNQHLLQVWWHSNQKNTPGKVVLDTAVMNHHTPFTTIYSLQRDATNMENLKFKNRTEWQVSSMVGFSFIIGRSEFESWLGRRFWWIWLFQWDFCVHRIMFKPIGMKKLINTE